MLIRCNTCASKPDPSRTLSEQYQDEHYGHNVRVHNPCGQNKTGDRMVRCVCCLNKTGVAQGTDAR